MQGDVSAILPHHVRSFESISRASVRARTWQAQGTSVTAIKMWRAAAQSEDGAGQETAAHALQYGSRIATYE